MQLLNKSIKNIYVGRFINIILAILILYILKTKDYAFSFDSLLPYIFFIFIFSLIEFRNEIAPPQK